MYKVVAHGWPGIFFEGTYEECLDYIADCEEEERGLYDDVDENDLITYTIEEV